MKNHKTNKKLHIWFFLAYNNYTKEFNLHNPTNVYILLNSSFIPIWWHKFTCSFPIFFFQSLWSAGSSILSRSSSSAIISLLFWKWISIRELHKVTFLPTLLCYITKSCAAKKKCVKQNESTIIDLVLLLCLQYNRAFFNRYNITQRNSQELS